MADSRAPDTLQDSEVWRPALTAQQLVKAAVALEACVSGLVDGAALVTVQQTVSDAHLQAQGMAELLVALVQQVERVLIAAELSGEAAGTPARHAMPPGARND